MTRVLPILVLVAGVTTCHAAEDIYGETKDEKYWSLTLVIPSNRITLPEMEKVAREFLKRAASHRVVVLSVLSTRDVAARERGAMCHSYKQWKVYYDEFPRDPLVAANVIGIGGDAVLRLRSADGTVTRRVLNGKDPTQFSIGGTSFEILVVAGRKMTGFIPCDVAGGVGPELYVRTEAKPSVELCARATNWLAETLRTDQLFASFRNDHWFLCHVRFPLLYPFSPPEPPPSETEYHNSVSFTCSIYCGDKPRCAQTMGPSVAPPRMPVKR